MSGARSRSSSPLFLIDPQNREHLSALSDRERGRSDGRRGQTREAARDLGCTSQHDSRRIGHASRRSAHLRIRTSHPTHAASLKAAETRFAQDNGDTSSTGFPNEPLGGWSKAKPPKAATAVVEQYPAVSAPPYQPYPGQWLYPHVALDEGPVNF
jgi:hypothetical protein